MKYIENWEKIQKKYQETWALENHDRPLMHITSWHQRTAPISKPQSNEALWLDTDYVVRNARYIIENQHYAGESFPSVYANLGPDIFAACYGADLRFGETTSWSVPFIDDWEKNNLLFDFNGKWYKKIIEITENMVEDAKEDYIVGITDIHPGMDALAAMRGSENLCMDLYDCGDLIKPLPIKLFEGFKKLYNELYQRTNKYTKGATTWMKVYSEERFYVTSCDFICMISKNDFDDYVKEELIAEAKWLDKTIFHLDGPGALRHLDTILDIKEIAGVQWVPGAGAASIHEWGEVLTKIQKANKVLQINVNNAHELKMLSEIIRPEGVMIDSYASNAQDADDMVALASKLWKK